MLRLNAKPMVLFVFSAITVAAAGSSLNEQLPAGPARGKAIAACSTCHEPRIIVQQRLSKAAWTKEVDKMIRWGAEVDPNDRDALIDYFTTNFNADQAAYVAPRTLPGSKPHPKAKP